MESTTPNTVIRQQALDALKGQWGLAIGTMLLYGLLNLIIAFIPFVSTIVSLVITGPFRLGTSMFSLSLSRGRDAKLEQIFQGFNNFGTAFLANLLMGIYVFLWMLLLIIPGIIAALSYSMTFFIIADDPTIKPGEAIDKSKAMMDGNKMKLFLMYLNFFLLSLACVLTLGIGYFWLIPFMQVTMAKFYDDVKGTPALTAAEVMDV